MGHTASHDDSGDFVVCDKKCGAPVSVTLDEFGPLLEKKGVDPALGGTYLELLEDLAGRWR